MVGAVFVRSVVSAQKVKAFLNATTAKPAKTAAIAPSRSIWESALVNLRKTHGLRNEKQAAKALLDQLTSREREVLGFGITGGINRKIVTEPGTTENTVPHQRGHHSKKLKAGSVAELGHFSLQCSLKLARP